MSNYSNIKNKNCNYKKLLSRNRLFILNSDKTYELDYSKVEIKEVDKHDREIACLLIDRNADYISHGILDEICQSAIKNLSKSQQKAVKRARHITLTEQKIISIVYGLLKNFYHEKHLKINKDHSISFFHNTIPCSVWYDKGLNFLYNKMLTPTPETKSINQILSYLEDFFNLLDESIQKHQEMRTRIINKKFRLTIN